MTGLYWIDASDEDSPFPPVESAMTDPDGLLAAGGTLQPRRLMLAYRKGIFPWYSAGQPILWWSPDPRCVLYPENLRVSRSLHKTMRKGYYHVTVDTAFRRVMEECAAPRTGAEGTWITPSMLAAYTALHRMGVAHSVEVWAGGALVGGLYGVSFGRVFCGESMFSRRSDASKVAFVCLVRQLQRWGFAVVDCQIQTSHLQSFGAENIPRREFVNALDSYADRPGPPTPWRFDADLVTSSAARP